LIAVFDKLTVHSNASHDTLTQMLLLSFQYRNQSTAVTPTYGDLQHQAIASVIRVQGIENGRQLVGVKFDC
jgi:hypothetical protein